MTDPRAQLEPQLWVDDTAAAIDFYERAFGAQTVHRVGGPADTDGVAQLSIAGARFWVAGSSDEMGRFSPRAIAGATGRLLLVVEDPYAVVAAAAAHGGVRITAVGREHDGCSGVCATRSATSGRSGTRSLHGRRRDEAAPAARECVRIAHNAVRSPDMKGSRS